MAILTRSAFNMLISNFSENVTDDEIVSYENFLKNVFNNKMLFFIFNKWERQKLFGAKHLLEDEKEFLGKYYRVLAIKEDKMEFVYQKGGKYKYHLYSDCSSVNSDYTDFAIPQEIRDLGSACVNEFRSWFDSNGFRKKYLEIVKIENCKEVVADPAVILIKKSILNSQIVENYNSIFPVKYKVHSIGLDYFFITKFENSGKVEIEANFSKTEFKNELDVLLSKRLKLISKNKEFRQKLARLDFLLHKDDKFINNVLKDHFSEDILCQYKVEDYKKFWVMHSSIKKEIYKLLIKYFQWTYHFSSRDYDEVDLEKFGLECCLKCNARKSNEVQEVQIV